MKLVILTYFFYVISLYSFLSFFFYINDRPNSLTCVCCKILEYIICTDIRHHLDTHNILPKLQHGFRSRHSCVSQLTITINDLLTHRDKRTQIDMAILDFSKAFDTFPPQRLLGKLKFFWDKATTTELDSSIFKG